MTDPRRKAIVLTPRSENRLLQLVRRDNAQRLHGAARARGRGLSPPTVAIAVGDISKFEKGTFLLQKGLPDAFTDGDEREAWALADFAATEHALLHWTGGEESDGYWSAIHPAGSGGTSAAPCLCDLIDILEDNLTITAQEASDMRTCAGCNTVPTTDCFAVVGGKMPSTVALRNVTGSTSQDTFNQQWGHELAGIVNAAQADLNPIFPCSRFAEVVYPLSQLYVNQFFEDADAVRVRFSLSIPADYIQVQVSVDAGLGQTIATFNAVDFTEHENSAVFRTPATGLPGPELVDVSSTLVASSITGVAGAMNWAGATLEIF